MLGAAIILTSEASMRSLLYLYIYLFQYFSLKIQGLSDEGIRKALDKASRLLRS